jgi:hypothetical protein
MRRSIHWGVKSLILLLILSSCKRDASTNWNAGILAPLASTNLTIENLIKDSVLHTNSDSSLSIVYQNTVYTLNLAEQYIHIPDTSIGQKYTVDSLQLPNVSFYDKISLGQMALNLVAQNNILGNYLINQNGHHDSVATISGLSLTPFYFSAAGYFQTATLSNADVAVNVDNRLPLALQNVNFELRNAHSNTLVLSGFFANIPPNSSGYLYYHLHGVTIESSLAVKITSFTIPGTGSSTVLIDTSNYIAIGAYISNLRVDSAIAVFPSQDIISQDQELTQNIGDRKFTYVDCKSGQLNVTITNAVKQPLHLTYKLVGAYDKFGHPLTAISDVPAQQNGQLGTINRIYDLSGFVINLTGIYGTKFNTYTQIIIAHIDSTGIETKISSSDSVHIQYFLQNIKPNYIKGYAGRDTISYAGTSPFSLANLLSNNTPNALKFNKASISVSIDNGIGVDGQVIINSLSSVNANGNTVALVDNSTSPVIGRPLYIGKATDFPLTPTLTTFNINSTTSNINDFISNLPNQVKYNVTIKTNPLGNRGTYSDFAYLTSGMNVNLNVNIPLSLIANNLTLRDSFSFSLGYSKKDVANILNGTLHLIVYNKFPLQANITLLAYDSSWHLLDTLLSSAQIDAAPIGSSCKASQPAKSVLNVTASAQVIDKLRSSAHAIMTVVFNTRNSNATCNGQYVNIYSDYNIAATITGDFNYKVKF